MKKLLATVVLGLLWNNSAFAQNLMLSCSFDKVFFMDWKEQKFGKTYKQSDLADNYDDIYVEINFSGNNLNSFRTNYNLLTKMEDAVIDDAYFIIRYKPNPKGIYQKIYIDRYTGTLKTIMRKKGEEGYELSHFYNCQKKAKKF